MWKLLIVEDEVHVRNYLIKNVNWLGYGFEIVGAAGHGEDALELMRRHEPDVVMADIMMPVMDGLELLKQARANGFRALFVMLTCVNEFEYAQQALRHGAYNYILKLSMTVELLQEELAKLDGVLTDKMTKQAAELSPAYYALYRTWWDAAFGRSDAAAHEGPDDPAARAYRHLTIVSVLHGGTTPPREELLSRGGPETDKHNLLHAYSAYGHTTFFCWSHRKLPLSAPRERASCGAVVMQLEGREHAARAWRACLRGLDAFWYGDPAERLCFSDLPDAAPGPEPDSVAWKMERQLMQAFEELQLERCRQLLAEMWDMMRRQPLSWMHVKQTALRLDRQFGRMMNRTLPDMEPAMNGAVRHEQSRDMLAKRMEAYLFNRDELRTPRTDHDEINKIIDYIEGHCEREITLKSMAQLVHMEQHYLSGLFKQKTGENLITYLHKIRIHRAAYLLKHTNLTCALIGEKVGFSNDNYFIKIFKRWMGMTPNDYRSAAKEPS